MHVACLAAPFTFTWSGLVVFGGLVWLTGAIGVTLTFHRLLTHRSFSVPAWLEYVLTVIGTLAWQGGAVQWVGTHRLHHKHSDGDEDPHTPRHGFTWAHMLWCMHREAGGPVSARQAAGDLVRDPVHRWIDRLFWLPQVLLAVGLYFAGQWWSGSGWSWVVWGVAARVVFVYHGTWFVNSAAHTWGYRNYETPDGSTNLWWVGLLAFGEGWHNNHHAHQRSAAHGQRWWELDMTYWTIRALGWVGLARDICLPGRRIRRRAVRSSAPVLGAQVALTPDPQGS
ncbi:MAG: hypothetical protein BIFFINMI_01897 [Phycisphaerae bacterium]|nr:hypothetical protein [Phycisphaerae bacterium]